MSNHFPEETVQAAAEAGIIDSLPTEIVKYPEVDRTTLENYATCPLMAWLLERNVVLNATDAMNVGHEVHECFSQVTAEYVASGDMLNASDLADMLRGYMNQSRPDVQPQVIEAMRKTIWPWAQFISGIHAENILRFDGGKGDARKGQIGHAIPHLKLMPTTELDLLYAGPSKQQLHVRDYKGGHQVWTAAEVKASFQFQMQGCLVLWNYPEVESVEIKVWNTRINRETYGIEIERRWMAAIEQRIVKAATHYANYHHIGAAIDVPAWPSAEKCEQCRCVTKCHVVPPSEVDADPAAYLLAMNVAELNLKAMKKAATAYVDRTGGDIEAPGGLRFGREKPKAERNSAGAIYSVKGE